MDKNCVDVLKRHSVQFKTSVQLCWNLENHFKTKLIHFLALLLMFLGLTDNAVCISISRRALRSCIPSVDGAQTCCRKSWHVSGNDTWCFRIWSFLPLSLCSRQHCHGKQFGTNCVFLLLMSILPLSVFIVPFFVNVPALLDRTSIDSAKLVVKRHQHKKSKSASISCCFFSSSSCSSS